LTITAIRHLFILIADLLAAISNLLFVLYFLFQGASAAAAAETERRQL
jgi:hypothetical protein